MRRLLPVSILLVLLVCVSSLGAAEAQGGDEVQRLAKIIRELRSQVRDLTRRAEAAEREAIEAKSELDALKARTRDTLPRGEIEDAELDDGKFTYGNLTRSVGGKHTELLGEIQNGTRRDWSLVSFRVSVYGEADELLATDTFSVRVLRAGATKAFENTIWDLPPSPNHRLRFYLESAHEREDGDL